MEGITFEVWGLGGAVAVGVVMAGIKYLFPAVKDRLAVAIAIGVGLILSTIVYLAGLFPEVQTWLNVVGQGLLAALSAGGLYSAVKKRP